MIFRGFCKPRGAATSLIVFVLSVGLAFSRPPVVFAQAPAPAIWQARVLRSETSGVSDPIGLAYSKQVDAFQVLEGVSSAGVSVVAVSRVAGNAGTRSIAAAVADPINITFDNRQGRLLMLSGEAGQFLEVLQGPDGHPDPLTLTRRSLPKLAPQSPQGIAVDESGGTLYALDAAGPRLFKLGLETGSLTIIPLNLIGIRAPRGLAFDPSTGHLHVIVPAEQALYELGLAGNLIAVRSLAAIGLNNPQGLAFAPSGDRLDPPARMSLYVADAASQGNPGRIVELSFQPPAPLPVRTGLLPADLVRTFRTDDWTEPSPDPSGLDYWPAMDRLVITDSEVEERVAANPPAYWHGRNVFITTLGGELTGGCTTYSGTTRKNLLWNDFNNEPTGFAINTDRGHFYFSNDDNENKLYDVGFGLDGVYCTPDDVVTRVLVTTRWGAIDSEDLAYGDNTLYLADGTDAEVYVIPLGRDGTLGSPDDGPVTHWDTAALGFHDLEGIAYNADRGTLFIVSAVGRENYLGETSLTGTLLRAYDLSFMGSLFNLRSDVTWAPSSTDPNARSVYIASRGVDNNTKRLSNDGKIWEVRLGPDAPAPAPAPRTNFLDGVTVTATAGPTRVHVPALPDVIFADGFESGNLSAWTSSSSEDGGLLVNRLGALSGSLGMQAVLHDDDPLFVTDDRPAGEPRYRARFHFDPNSVRTAGDVQDLLVGYSGSASYTAVLKLSLRSSSGDYQLRGALLDNDQVWIYSDWVPLTDAPHSIELDWRAARGAAARDGFLHIWLDGVQALSMTEAANGTWRMDRVRLGVVSESGRAEGSFRFDAFESRRRTYIGP